MILYQCLLNSVCKDVKKKLVPKANEHKVMPCETMEERSNLHPTVSFKDNNVFPDATDISISITPTADNTPDLEEVDSNKWGMDEPYREDILIELARLDRMQELQ